MLPATRVKLMLGSPDGLDHDHERLPEAKLSSLVELVQFCEAIAALGRPAESGPPPRVKTLALNTARLDQEGGVQGIARAQDWLGLPCVDPARSSVKPILEALWS